MAATTTAATAAGVNLRRHKKVVVIMGPTGCGKSKLAVELASRFFPSSEIINSDKIQVYRGLDITTNKIPLSERKNVPHHLLGEFDSQPEFTPADFRSSAAFAISDILSQGRVPFVVGGSNSFIYALLVKKFDPTVDVFDEPSAFCNELRYKCCFIWVDVSPPELNRYLVERVDDMLESGMFEELADYFSDTKVPSKRSGLNRAIGVPEFEKYFNRFPNRSIIIPADDVARREAYEEAVRSIEDNTCRLAKRQLWKIQRLRDAAGWDLNRVDATAAMGGDSSSEIWEREVVEPSVKIVKRFLME
ncbi:adenylate isopentenyltransferase-like [Andrographis paniculata]|uniref:adenylate isopentenyltransferase-like n=1 Tax=Andrographis paniculata TaxID=175694 RepID=UPI0021E971AE|nr:adenylate isopentenyltransferase-like [Andrographis paniculata]